MSKAKIRGGQPLHGKLVPSGNKNAALPIIAASLLISGESQISNLPLTIDVRNFVKQLASLGCGIELNGNTFNIKSNNINSCQIGEPLPTAIQGVLLLAPAIIMQHNKAIFEGINPLKERISTHLRVLSDFGVEIKASNNQLALEVNQLLPQKILLYEASVTATELSILLALLAKGVSEIYNAACEPHVQDLIKYLSKCGANIEGGGTNLLRIEGGRKLTGSNHCVSYDHIEVGSFIAMAAMTQGEIEIENVSFELMQPIMQQYHRLGISCFYSDGVIKVPKHHEIVLPDPIGEEYFTITSSPWPNFPSDLVPLIAVMATQTKGAVLIHEKMYNSRMYFVDTLISMGAQVVQCDPHRVIVVGPKKLYSTYMETPDLRSGLALLGAALVAQGDSVIDDIQILDRIFYGTQEKLGRLGAHIKLV